MKKSGTVVDVLASFSEPLSTAVSSGLPVDPWCPRLAAWVDDLAWCLRLG